MPATKLPLWYPDHPPIYDITRSYLENAETGPFFDGVIPKRTLPSQEARYNFLGFSVASRIGVAAGPLLNSKWIALAAKLGYDIPVYKTIRTKEYNSHPMPNVIYVNTHGPLHVDDVNYSVEHILSPPKHIEDLAITNSFGMPSKSPAFLLEDIHRANASLQEGQVMVVSVVGSVNTERSLIEDFVAVATLAKAAGAKIIEANFSCPNVQTKEGYIYMSPSAVTEIGKALVKAIHPTPLIIKLGTFSSKQLLQEVLTAAAQGGIQAISGINSVRSKVVNTEGGPPLGPNRLTSGICGGPILPSAVRFITQSAEIIQKEKLDLTLVGVGGISLPDHFDTFFHAGANFAMTATGMMWDPYLAARYHTKEQK
jgi:dihydroorotate dehydrogenase (NAD+) catalytic subunit